MKVMQNSSLNQLTNLVPTYTDPLDAEHHRKNSSMWGKDSGDCIAASVDLPFRQGLQEKCELPVSSPVDELIKETASGKKSHVRWGYLVPRFVLLSLFWIAMAFGLDPMLRFGFTTGAGASLGTTVGVDKLQTDLLSPSLLIKRIQIADRDNPKKNAIEIDQFEVKLDRNALLRKKFVVDQAVVSGITWNTDSTLSVPQNKSDEQKSWSLPFRLGVGKISDAAKQSGTDLLEELLMQALTPYDPRNLETVQLAKIKEEQWDSRFDTYRLSAKQYKARIEILKKQIELSRKGNPLDNLNQYAQIARDVDTLIEEGKRLKLEFGQLGTIARDDMNELDAARSRDYGKLRDQIASLPVNPEQFTQTILGPETRRQFEEVSRWIQFVQKIMNVASADYQPERTYGSTISFDQADRLPVFLIREFHLNGVATGSGQPVPFSGLVKNITHAPKQYGKPVQFDLLLSNRGTVHLKGVIDLTGEVPEFSLIAKVETQEFPVQRLADNDKLQFALVTGKMQGLVKLKLTGDDIDAQLSWNQSDVSFLVNGNLKLEQAELSKLGFAPISPVELLRQSVDGINGIHGEASIRGSLKSPAIELRSNIGELVASRLQDEFRKEALLRREEARMLAEQQIKQQMQKLTGKIEKEYKSVLADLNLNESLAQNLVEKVAVRPASGILNRLFR